MQSNVIIIFNEEEVINVQAEIAPCEKGVQSDYIIFDNTRENCYHLFLKKPNEIFKDICENIVRSFSNNIQLIIDSKTIDIKSVSFSIGKDTEFYQILYLYK